jgi:hypothetical protein
MKREMASRYSDEWIKLFIYEIVGTLVSLMYIWYKWSFWNGVYTQFKVIVFILTIFIIDYNIYNYSFK